MASSLPVQLRALRTRRGWTLFEAARKIGTTPDNLSRLERGMRHPRAATLKKLADAYGVDLEALLTQDLEDRTPPFSSLTQDEQNRGPGSEGLTDEDLRVAIETYVHSGVDVLYHGDASPEEAVRRITDGIMGHLKEEGMFGTCPRVPATRVPAGRSGGVEVHDVNVDEVAVGNDVLAGQDDVVVGHDEVGVSEGAEVRREEGVR